MHSVSMDRIIDVSDNDFVGVPLSVCFASGEDIETCRSARGGTLILEPPFHLSENDMYLVLPDDIGIEIVDILRDGDTDLLEESMRDGLLVVGTMDRSTRGRVELHVEQAATPAELLARNIPYAAVIEVGGKDDPLKAVNALEHLQCTMTSALFDEEGLDRALRSNTFVGTSWRVPKHNGAGQGIDPSFVWSKRLDDGSVGVELALFLEYEELVVVLRPVTFRG